ncbi:hypothetical protein MUP77_14565 [Candidatus Bathyarchaeota archaeon]|nr:hypothetical protein [Candidatus Bathyarchaeota archaeon]
MSVDIRRLLIEAVKPRDTSTLDLIEALCSVEGVDECDLIVTDTDVRTVTFKVTVKGPDINYDELKKTMDTNGLAIKGIDEVNVVKARKPPMS